MLSTTQKGGIAETAIIAERTRLEYSVSVPLAGDSPSDLVADDGVELVRVQVKHGRVDGELVDVSLTRTDPNHNESNESRDSSEEIDVCAVDASEIDRSFWIPFEEAPETSLRIRHAGDADIDHPAIRWADEYDLAARLS